MTRPRALALIAMPIAFVMAADDARVRAQDVTTGPMMAIRSGIDLASLDRGVNPSEDFYQFACGGWISSHPTPPYLPRIGLFEHLHAQTYPTNHAHPMQDSQPPDGPPGL